MNFLVETKTEYTIQLINIITPFMYEGFKSIYEEAKKVSKNGDELKIFQTFLRRIPTWTEEVIKAETKRILTDSNCSDILEDLLKAVIKSNIMILTNTSPDRNNKLKINFVVEFDKFIHNAYIESAKNIFQNPFLFFHKCLPLELKRNEREATELIKTSITDAIRKMLPINMILKEYLGESFTDSQQEQHIDRLVSEQDKKRITQLLAKSNDFNGDYKLEKRNALKDGISINNEETERQKEKRIEQGSKSEQNGGNNSDNSDVSISYSESEDENRKKSKKNHNESLNTIDKAKDKMPVQFKKKQEINDVAASESYMPNRNMKIFEAYTTTNKKNMNGRGISKEHEETEKTERSDRSEINSVSASLADQSRKNKTNNTKKIYIDRDFKFNF